MNEPTANAAALTFEQIYEQYFDLVWATTRRLGITPEAMDDVVQEVFMVVHSKLAPWRILRPCVAGSTVSYDEKSVAIVERGSSRNTALCRSKMCLTM